MSFRQQRYYAAAIEDEFTHESTGTSSLWPPAAYHQQITRLRAAIGQEVFLAEMNETAMNMGIKITDHALILLAVVDFPRPDPYRQLCPHMLILDDGRGINLGRIARISTGQAFGPSAEQTLYQNHDFLKETLFAPRALSRALMTETTKRIARKVLGDKPGRLLENCYKEEKTVIDTTLNKETDKTVHNDKITRRRLKRS